MTESHADGWRGRLRNAYAQMVDVGVYSVTFRHAEDDRGFVADTLAPAIASLPPRAAVLEVGCGAGEWLELVGELLDASDHDSRLRYGFDLTPEMVALATERLGGSLPAGQLRVGDLLIPESYDFGRGEPFGLVYAYDVIQQLPRSVQLDGVRAMYSNVDPGGVLVVFDQDAASPAGRRMEGKKAITRWLRIPLVPRFYLVAQYPRAASVAEALRAEGAEVELRRAGGARMAIVARRPGRSAGP